MIAVAAFALVPSSGCGIAACTARGAVIALGGTGGWWQLAGVRGRHPDEAVDGVRSVWRVLVRFALVAPFGSRFDQRASTWGGRRTR